MTPFELFMKLLWPVGAGVTWFFVRPHFGLLAALGLSVVGAFAAQLLAVFVVAGFSALTSKKPKDPPISS